MRRNKGRLYIALYYHKRKGEYHWALLFSPKSHPERATRYHATNKLQERDDILKTIWEFEQLPLAEVKGPKLLAKILIGKVKSSRQNFEISLKRVPIEQDNPKWTCRTWVKNSIAQLLQDNILSDRSIVDWEFIETQSRSYASRKTSEGRFKIWTGTTPTYDLMAQHEIEA